MRPKTLAAPQKAAPIAISLIFALTTWCIGTGAAWAQEDELPSVDALFAPSSDEVDAQEDGALTPQAPPLQEEEAQDKASDGDASKTAPGLPPSKLEVVMPKEEQPALVPATSVSELPTPFAPPIPAPDEAKAAPSQAPSPSQLSEPLPFGLVQQLFEEIQRERDSDVYTLKPYIQDDRWTLAIESFEADKCTDALKHAREAIKDERAAPPAIQYMIARMQLCSSKESALGRQTLTTLAEQDDGVGYLARRALGKSTPDLHAIALEGLKPKRALPSPEDLFKKWLALGKNKERWAHAVEGLDRLRAAARRGSDWYRITLAQAEILERHDQIEAASRLWVGMFLRTRGWRSAKTVERDFLAFERRHKLDLRDLQVRLDELRAMVEEGDLKDARKHSEQVAKFAKVSGDELKGWTLYRQALEAERRRDREDAAALFAKADKLIAHPAMRPRHYFAWARALRRLNKDMEAIGLYRRLCEEYPHERELCAESLYQAGRLLQYENKFEEAFDAFFMLAGFYPESERMVETHWRAALCAYMLKRYEQAESLWAEVEQRWPDELDSAALPMGLRARYWRGVIALKQDHRLEAVSHLSQALSMGPLTWYGRLATARLKQLGIDPPTGLPLHRYTVQDTRYLEGMTIPKDPRYAMAAPLIRLGLASEALAEVQRYAYRSQAPEGALGLMAALSHAVGDFTKAHWMAQRQIKLSGPTADNQRLWAASYPLAHIEHVHTYAQKYKVSPMLVLAIMRQESGFRATVKSYAGALGLMQLMPGTARYTAKVFVEDDGYRAKQIFEPETNIKLGSMYIRMHTAYAADQIPLALAGYNAGPAPLKRWFEDYKGRELDAWVESITFTQARGYVRKVMTSYIAYTALYGDGKLPELELELPKSLRKWGQVPEVGSEAVSMLDPVELDEDEVALGGLAHERGGWGGRSSASR